MDFESRRLHLLISVLAVVALSFTAEKCRELVGEDGSSQSGKFTILNCFDMGSGTVACAVKEGVKLYFYNIRSSHVESARIRAIESALVHAVGQGMSPTDSAKHAQKEGFLRGSGTLFGTYGGGFLGEQRLGRFGYLVGSHLGSWVGGRIGLMVYDVVNGLQLLLQFVQTGEIVVREKSEPPESSFFGETPVYDSSEDSKFYESPPSEESYAYESPPSEESYADESTGLLANHLPTKNPMPRNLLNLTAMKHMKILN
ncbi:hypothetical protein ACSQ67_015224 [Phaseolus vulgaris]